MVSRSSRPTARSSPASGASCTSSNAVGWRSSRSAVTTPSGLLSIRWTASCSATRRSSSITTVNGSRPPARSRCAALRGPVPPSSRTLAGLDQPRGGGARAGEVAGQQDVEAWHGSCPMSTLAAAVAPCSRLRQVLRLRLRRRPLRRCTSCWSRPRSPGTPATRAAPAWPSARSCTWSSRSASRSTSAPSAAPGLDYWARVVPNLRVWPTWDSLAGAAARAGHAVLLRAARRARLPRGPLSRRAPC